LLPATTLYTGDGCSYILRLQRICVCRPPQQQHSRLHILLSRPLLELLQRGALHQVTKFNATRPSLHSIRALITSAVHDIPNPCLSMVCPLPRPTSYQHPSTCSTCRFGFLPSDADEAVHDAAASLKQQLQRIPVVHMPPPQSSLSSNLKQGAQQLTGFLQFMVYGWIRPYLRLLDPPRELR
jgi:hypothetical protein